MKTFLLFAFACILIIACNKTGLSTLAGRWSVVSDSTITSGALISYDIYNGNDNDYFDFESNGLLQTKEDGADKTYSYELKPGKAISITQTGAFVDAIQQSGTYFFTGNKARILVAPDLTNPGFSYQRIINLKR